MKKIMLLIMISLLTTSVLANFEKESLESFIDESGRSCFTNNINEVVLIQTKEDRYNFEVGTCSLEVFFGEVYFYSDDFPRKKYKWICSPAGAGQKSKCYKVSK